MAQAPDPNDIITQEDRDLLAEAYAESVDNGPWVTEEVAARTGTGALIRAALRAVARARLGREKS
jgi:hypothetical protein